MFWKRFLRVFTVLAASTVAACLLYPVVQGAVHQWTDWTYPPARVFRRIWMLTVLAGLIAFGKWLGMRRPGKVGFSFNKNSLPNLGLGLACVFTFLAGLSLFYSVIGAWQVPDVIPTEKLRKKLVQGLLRGTLVSGLEEYVFRGLIFLSLCKSWSWKRSAVVTSLIFSSLHFLEGRGDESVADPAAWNSGFQVCGMLFSNMYHHFHLFPDAVGLFVVGMALCHGAWRTGSLWYGAGLHGGWIWFFTFRSSLLENTGSLSELWIGGGRLFNGVIPILAMLMIFPVTEWMVRRGWLGRADGRTRRDFSLRSK